MNMMLDILIAVYGAYLVYAAFTMKRTGKIQNMMISKGLDLKRAKDIDGYIKHTFGISVAIGIVCILAGGVGLYNDYYGGLEGLYLVVIIIFGISLMIYGVLMVRAQKKYLQP